MRALLSRMAVALNQKLLTWNSLVRIPLAAMAATLAACSDPTAAPLSAPPANSPTADITAITATAAQSRLLATVRQATARYHRVEAALADGYEPASPCEAIAEGGVGVHYR